MHHNMATLPVSLVLVLMTSMFCLTDAAGTCAYDLLYHGRDVTANGLQCNCRCSNSKYGLVARACDLYSDKRGNTYGETCNTPGFEKEFSRVSTSKSNRKGRRYTRRYISARAMVVGNKSGGLTCACQCGFECKRFNGFGGSKNCDTVSKNSISESVPALPAKRYARRSHETIKETRSEFNRKLYPRVGAEHRSRFTSMAISARIRCK